MKWKILVLVLLLAIIGGYAFGEVELGLGISPPLGSGGEGDVQEDPIFSTHVGYSFWWLFYASWDAYILPPSAVEDLTTGFGDGGEYVRPGVFRPGFMNMFDAGIRPNIGPIMILGEIGINHLYVYKQSEVEDQIESNLGVNMRVGAGLRWNSLSLMLSATAVFPNFESMQQTFEAMASDNAFVAEEAQQQLVDSLYPTITLSFFF